MHKLTVAQFQFTTKRLSVNEWRSSFKGAIEDSGLKQVVASILTEPVTRSLPESWQGEYTLERVAEWVRDRDDEGITLLVSEKSSAEPVGMLILSAAQVEDVDGKLDMRLGYLFSEAAWGQGLATELVAGFVKWCRGFSWITSITGGVAADNPASIKVLERNGFTVVEDTGDERLYRLEMTQAPKQDCASG